MVTEGSMSDDAFVLEVLEKQVMIKAKNPRGFYYGLRALATWFTLHPHKTPCSVIFSEPTIKHRGYMLDISRCKVPHLNEIKSRIRSLAKCQINHLELYMEHTFAFKNHSQVWGDASPSDSR